MLSCRKCLSLQKNLLNIQAWMKIKPNNYGKWVKPTNQLPTARTASLFLPSSCQRTSSYVTHGQDNSYSNEDLLEDHLAEEFQEDDVVIHTEELEGVPIIQGDMKPKKKETAKGNQAKGKSTKKKDADLKKELANTSEQISREVIQRRNMACYLTVCLQQKMNFKAIKVLRSYHKSKKLTKSSEVYDAVLLEASAACDWNLIREVVQMMEADQIPLSLLSFISCFTCLGSRSLLEHGLEPVAQNLLDKMATYNLRIENVFLSHRYSQNQREMLIRGIRLARPDFEPVYPSVSVDYRSELVEALNDRRIHSDVKPLADGTNLTAKKLSEMVNQQCELELSDNLCIPSISTVVPDEKAIAEVDALEASWEVEVREAVSRHLAISKAHFELSYRSRLIHIYPFLTLLSEEDLVRLIMNEVKVLARSSEVFSPSLYQLSRDLGHKVMELSRMERKRSTGVLEKFRAVYADYCHWFLYGKRSTTTPKKELGYDWTEMHYNPRQMWQNLIVEYQKDGPDLDLAEKWGWPHSVMVGVGEFIYNIIINSLKISVPVKGRGPNGTPNSNVKVAAFYLVYRTKGFKTNREIKPHPHLVELWQVLRHSRLSFDSTLLPMFSPSLPWHTVTTGGYLSRSVKLVRVSTRFSDQNDRMKSNPYQYLYPSFDALNVLGSVPWAINGRILDLAIDIFNAGGSKELDVAVSPATLPPLPVTDSTGLTSEERLKLNKERANQRRIKSEMYSLWCDALYRLSLANFYRDKVFWFPHSLDFRGRAYPCSPHLTYLAHDMGRALFRFAQGKPLGPRGLDWLKVHTINLTGTKKKEPVSERLRYANEILPDIIDSAQHPMTGKKWWMKSDEPWQTLAACIEVEAALQCPEGPASYISHLPIHQDGSCNGLQHYAALGRDQVGAESVNLVPAERPGDVYATVASLVERERAKDAAQGNEIAIKLEGKISRRIVKPTVMTAVYGVTRFGARLQIIKQLKELGNFPTESLTPCATYLTDKTFSSLKEMFSSAREIQEWLTGSAKMICSVAGRNVEWVTPLGLPVVQPYVKEISERLSKPNGLKQKNGFPPNFIHSLDSSHMMLTALFCQRQGITFAAVHDCFWTHPCTVDPMNKICREQFVSLHSQPILEDLSKFLVSRFSVPGENDTHTEKSAVLWEKLNQILREVPRRGTFDLRRVLDSVYFFS